MKYRNLSISLPAQMAEHVDRAAEREHRTRSELIREALRLYLSGIPSEEPTNAERAAMARGSAEIRSGEYVTLDQLLHDVAPRRRPVRAKGA